MSTPAHRRLLVVPLLAVLAVGAAGCGSGTGQRDEPSASGGAVAGPVGDAGNLGNTGNVGSAISASQADAPALGSTGDAGAPTGRVHEPAVISTGTVELTSNDVGAARERVDAVLRQKGGRVADENTTTDDHGTVTATHLVVRVPGARFGSTMRALSQVATLRGSARKAEDVTTRVIDVKARIAAERAGVRRLRHLVSRAADLRALLAVERELTSRQGELQSLRQQRAYLADQTSRATITVDITRRTAPPTPPARAAGGFVGGLQHGWHALVAAVTGVLLGVGVVLPFAVLAALLGVPAWLVVRRVRRVRAPRAPAES